MEAWQTEVAQVTLFMAHGVVGGEPQIRTRSVYPEDVPPTESHRLIRDVHLESHGDDPESAFVVVSGDEEEAVRNAWRATASAFLAWWEEIWNE